MTFTTVSNPNGIVHSSACSDWDVVDANRAVLVTQSAGRSSTLFIQDIITQDGVTTIGDPYLVAVVAQTGVALNTVGYANADWALTPMVRSLGNGLFAIVCAASSTLSSTSDYAIYTYNGASFTQTAGQAIRFTRSWNVFLVKRAANGEFSLVATSAIPALSFPSQYNFRNTLPSTLENDATAKTITFRAYPFNSSSNPSQDSARQTAVLTYSDTSLVLNSNASDLFNVWPLTQGGYSYNLRSIHEKRLPDGTPFYLFDRCRSNTPAGILTTTGPAATVTVVRDPTVEAVSSNNAIYGEMSHIRPSGAGALVQSLGAGRGENDVYMLHSATTGVNGTIAIGKQFLAIGQDVLAPLDSAWIMDKIGVTLAGNYSYSLANLSQNSLALQANLHDSVMHVNTGFSYGPMINPQGVALFFRQMTGVSNVIAGLIDPLQLPYYIHSNRNHAKKMIKRVDDKTFIIIGVFSTDSVDANARLGVITVKLP